ncbi:MAG: tetratricopeptide repeat protein [Geobacteraceae bacterium]|nr:tetratricopeptide repeat protein [Geobacteraceae bacterium]
MTKKMFLRRLPAVAAVALAFALLFLPGAFCQETGESDAGLHNRQGMEYFKKGFYDHAPKKQAAEAERNYGLAIREFKAAISKDTAHTEAHRNLARVYYLQKNFEGAAEEYRRVTELAPNDLDAYVNLALALIEMKRTEEAIQTLENAKSRTSDPTALETLDSYISKVRAHEDRGVR